MASNNEPDENIESQLEAYALGILEPDEMAAVAAHVAGCARCQVELASLRRAVYAFALVADADDVALPEGHAERFARRLAAEDPQPVAARAPSAPPAAPPTRLAQPVAPVEPRRGWWPRLPALGWAAAGVLALFLVAAALWAVSLQGRLDAAQAEQARLQQQMTQLQADRDQLAAARDQAVGERDQLAQERATALSILSASDVVARPLTGTAALPGATGNLWIAPATNQAVLILRNLPPLAANQTYEFWLIADAPVASGIFQTDANGLAWLLVNPQQPLSAFKVAAVTAEPGQGGLAPQGPIVLQGGL